jgi:hypothetical protein
MNRYLRPTAIAPAVFVLALAGCEASKSSNPLSPSVAGPIAGVNITQPKLLEPTQGFKFKESQQPIKLLVENAATNGARTLTYAFEVSSDADFTNKVYARNGVPQGEGGRTSVVIERLELGRPYFWRARAEDGANLGTYSSASFELLPKAFLNPPPMRSPLGGATTSSRRPGFTVGRADRNATIGYVRYEFHIATNPAFTGAIGGLVYDDTGLDTTFVPPVDLTANTVHFWRVLSTDGETTSAWSPVESFRTPAAPAPGPAPGPSPGPPGSPGSCASSDGNAIVRCVESKYPQLLVTGVSVGQRIANMEFLRDRVIEAGICGGLDLAWNLKRGVGPRSTDALAWRHNGIVDVVDIGAAYDDTNIPLRLQWGVVEGPPGYDSYPRPNCS